ncbi:hypothetical protein JOQ06_010906, partial [Pogonophryne albipinna]
MLLLGPLLSDGWVAAFEMLKISSYGFNPLTPLSISMAISASHKEKMAMCPLAHI